MDVSPAAYNHVVSVQRIGETIVRMATRRGGRGPITEVYVAPPIDDAGWERLREMPGVVYHERTDGNQPRWTPWVQVNPLVDIEDIIEEDEVTHLLTHFEDGPQ